MPVPNPDPLSEAFDRCYPAIFRYFRYRGADVDTANDLASATFERGLVNLHRYDARKSQMQTWLFAIARNLGINHWKAEKPIAEMDESLHIPDALPEQEIILMQDKTEILLALQQLDHRAREIVAFKFGGRLTNRQIAELTGLTESNVGVILYRSLARLKILLTVPAEARHE